MFFEGNTGRDFNFGNEEVQLCKYKAMNWVHHINSQYMLKNIYSIYFLTLYWQLVLQKRSASLSHDYLSFCRISLPAPLPIALHPCLLALRQPDLPLEVIRQSMRPQPHSESRAY